MKMETAVGDGCMSPYRRAPLPSIYNTLYVLLVQRPHSTGRRNGSNPVVALNHSVAGWGTVSAAHAQHRLSTCLQGVFRAKSGADDSLFRGRARVD